MLTNTTYLCGISDLSEWHNEFHRALYVSVNHVVNKQANKRTQDGKNT